MLAEAIFLLMLLQAGYAHRKAHISITGGADPLPVGDDFPVLQSDLPQELQDAIGPGETLHEIIIKEDDKKHVIHMSREEFEASPFFNPRLNTESEQDDDPLEESPRSLDIREVDRQRGPQNYDNFSRDELILLLSRIQNLENTLPSNRQSSSSSKNEKRQDIQALARKIIVDESKLPGVPQPNGTRCVNKVIFRENIESDFSMKCHHILKDKCHVTYVTDYHANPEKKCGTFFKKNCHIQFKPVPHNENVKKCHTPLVKKCGDDVVGPDVCKIIYENFCETKFKTYEFEQDHPDCEQKAKVVCRNETIELFHHPHHHIDKDDKNFVTKEVCEKWPVRKCTILRKNVKKIHPDTECRRVGKKVCVPSNCIVIPGKEICHDQIQTVVQNLPEEDCNLDPFEQCRTESALVPKLIPTKECVKVPKEICINVRGRPKRVKKPIITKWCYDPRDLIKKIKEHV